MDFKSFLDTQNEDELHQEGSNKLIWNQILNHLNKVKQEQTINFANEAEYKIKTNHIAIGTTDIEYIMIKYQALEDIILNDLNSFKII